MRFGQSACSAVDGGAGSAKDGFGVGPVVDTVTADVRRMERSEIADCCESDVANTYRVWLRHELFQGRLTNSAFEASEKNSNEFIGARSKDRMQNCGSSDKPKP